MEKINLYHLSSDFPYELSEQEYKKLISMKQHGWTNCFSLQEWLAKLYYLRNGFKEGKITKEQFTIKERILILNWWKKNLK